MVQVKESLDLTIYVGTDLVGHNFEIQHYGIVISEKTDFFSVTQTNDLF